MARRPLRKRINSGNEWKDFIATCGGADACWAEMVIQSHADSKRYSSDLPFLRHLLEQFQDWDRHKSDVAEHIKRMERNQ